MLQYLKKRRKGWRPPERSTQIKGVGRVGPSRGNKNWIRRGHCNRNNSLCQARVGSRSSNTKVKHWNDEQDENREKIRTKKPDCISLIHWFWWRRGQKADHTVRIRKSHSKSQRKRRSGAKSINLKIEIEFLRSAPGSLQLKQQCIEKRGSNGLTSIWLNQNYYNFIITHLH